MEFFKKFFIRIKSKIKYFLGTFFVCFVLFLVPNVYASELIFGTNGGINIKNGSTYYVRIEDNINNLPFTTGIAGSGTLNTGSLSMWVSPASAGINVLAGMNYNYLIFDTCSTAGFTINISNNGCNGSCAMTGSYSSISTTSSCSVGSYTGTRRLVQVPIQKWYLNEVAEEFEVDSFITFTNSATWYNALKIQQVFLSDEDYIITYANQTELINKLDSVQTAITNMQNSINNNANTNAQNIINNQNQNTSAINGNVDEEFEKLKNQDHNYNNNAKDTPSGQNDINSTNSKESQVMEAIDLDSSVLDVTLNTDATSYIWTIVTTLRSINGKITLLFITVLSLGIIKMVLNR